MSTEPSETPSDSEPSEAELRAALEEQLRHISALDVIVQTAVSLVNLAGRRLGIAPGTEGERDLAQVRTAIDATRALLPVLEQHEGAETLGPLRDALAALQMEYAKQVQVGPAAPVHGATEPAAGAPQQPGDAQPGPAKPGAGPAQSSGRLWVPGSSGR
jgi:hypothetical protein